MENTKPRSARSNRPSAGAASAAEIGWNSSAGASGTTSIRSAASPSASTAESLVNCEMATKRLACRSVAGRLRAIHCSRSAGCHDAWWCQDRSLIVTTVGSATGRAIMFGS